MYYPDDTTRPTALAERVNRWALCQWRAASASRNETQLVTLAVTLA